MTPGRFAVSTHIAGPPVQARPPMRALPQAAAPVHPGARRLARWLPIVLLAIVALQGVFLITDADMWAHLKTGEYIVQHRSLPDRDPFVYTAGNDRWMIKAWVPQVIFYLVFRAAGFAGLTLLKAALFTLAVGLLWRLGRTLRCPAPAAVVVLLLLTAVARPRLAVRPEVPSFVLLAGALSILLRGTWGRAVYLLVPLQVLWANVHLSFMLGLLLPWPFLADAALRRLRGAREPLRHLALAAILLVPASALNPEGFRLLLHPFRVVRMPTVMVMEEMRGLLTILRANATFGAQAETEGIAFFILALGILALCALQMRSGIFVGPGAWTLAAGAIAMPFRVYRLLPYAGMILAGLAMRGLGTLVRPLPGADGHESRARWEAGLPEGASVLLMALVAFCLAQDPRVHFGLDVAPRMFPEGAARFILRANLRGPLLNDLNLGHYLVWSLFPRYKVFLHAGFWESASDDRLIARYFAAGRDPAAFDALASEYRAEILVLPSGSRALAFVPTDRRWALVYWDEVASVYVRRDGANAGLVAAHEFRLTHFALNPTYLFGLAYDPGTFQAAAAELRRAVREDPENVAAGVSLAVLLKERGQDLGEALEALEAAQRHGFRHAKLFTWKAEILARLGRGAAAEAAARQALRLDPADAIARSVLADLRARAGDSRGAEEKLHTDEPDGLRWIAP